MEPRFSEDIVPVTRMKNNPKRVIEQTTRAHRPVLLTHRGHGVAVVQSLEDFEKTQETLAFLQAVNQGIRELDAGQGLKASEVEKKFCLKI